MLEGLSIDPPPPPSSASASSASASAAARRRHGKGGMGEPAQRRRTDDDFFLHLPLLLLLRYYTERAPRPVKARWKGLERWRLLLLLLHRIGMRRHEIEECVKEARVFPACVRGRRCARRVGPSSSTTTVV